MFSMFTFFVCFRETERNVRYYRPFYFIKIVGITCYLILKLLGFNNFENCLIIIGRKKMLNHCTHKLSSYCTTF